MINVLAAIVLTLGSGLLDALGFVHASRVWRDDHLVMSEAARTFAYFLAGVGAYVFVVRYLDRLGFTAPELQTLMWFTVTVLGVAVIERSLGDWATIDRFVAAIALLSVGWLVARHG
ncbi:MAG: hypothetical protein ACJ71Z_01080 [Aeromicrobium sp.]